MTQNPYFSSSLAGPSDERRRIPYPDHVRLGPFPMDFDTFDWAALEQDPTFLRLRSAVMNHPTLYTDVNPFSDPNYGLLWPVDEPPDPDLMPEHLFSSDMESPDHGPGFQLEVHRPPPTISARDQLSSSHVKDCDPKYFVNTFSEPLVAGNNVSPHSSSPGTVTTDTPSSSSPSSPNKHPVSQRKSDGMGMKQSPPQPTEHPVPQKKPDDVGTKQSPSQPTEPDTFRQYDPADPTSLAEKRRRDKLEIEQQKLNVAALKQFGGSCIWCMRIKKKCEPALVCLACRNHGRTCYRSREDFCNTNSLMEPGVSPLEAKDLLYCLMQQAFKHFPSFTVRLNIRPYLENGPWTWTAEEEKINWLQTSESQCPAAELVNMIIQSIAPDLLAFEYTNGHDRLLRTAISMAKTFTASRWLMQANIHVLPVDVTSGRFVIFFLLVICFRSLLERSWSFCGELYDALHKPPPRDKTDLDPLWIACALYYRVACGMRDLPSNGVFATLLQSMCPLDLVCRYMKENLWVWMPRKDVTTHKARCAVLRDEIPTLRTQNTAELEFSHFAPMHELERMPPISMDHFFSAAMDPPPVDDPFLNPMENTGSGCIDPHLINGGDGTSYANLAEAGLELLQG